MRSTDNLVLGKSFSSDRLKKRISQGWDAILEKVIILGIVLCVSDTQVRGKIS